MSILGTSSFIFTGTGSPDSTARTLSHSYIEPEYQVEDLVILTNPLTGLRYFNLRGNYARFTVTYHVHKETNPKASALLIYTYLNKNVTIKPRGDLILKDGANANALFNLIKAPIYPLAKLAEQDVMYLTFESVGYVNMTVTLT